MINMKTLYLKYILLTVASDGIQCNQLFTYP